MENILVVPAAKLRPYLAEKGLIRGKEAELFSVIEREHLFIPRPDAEQDPTYKQIIPYITLCRGDEVFCTRRTNKGGEARLHGRLSLGIGGHINTLDDMESGDIFRRGLQRELEEEVFLNGGGELIPIGIINDDTNEVGSVHLGFFFTMEVTDASVRETEKLEGLWLKRSQLADNMNNMETWSQIACEALI